MGLAGINVFTYTEIIIYGFGYEEVRSYHKDCLSVRVRDFCWNKRL